MSIFSRIRAPEQKPVEEKITLEDMREFVEHTEDFPMGGPILRLDKDLCGNWSVELSDGTYVSLNRLASCWLFNNKRGGQMQAGLRTY